MKAHDSMTNWYKNRNQDKKKNNKYKQGKGKEIQHIKQRKTNQKEQEQTEDIQQIQRKTKKKARK